MESFIDVGQLKRDLASEFVSEIKDMKVTLYDLNQKNKKLESEVNLLKQFKTATEGRLKIFIQGFMSKEHNLKLKVRELYHVAKIQEEKHQKTQSYLADLATNFDKLCDKFVELSKSSYDQDDFNDENSEIDQDSDIENSSEKVLFKKEVNDEIQDN